MSFATFLGIRIKYIGAVPGSSGFTQREWNWMVRTALVPVGKRWWSEYRPKHFTREAFSRYGYHPRQKGWDIAKATATGESKPLVGMTGDTRRGAKTYRIVTRATQKRASVRVVMPLIPPYVNYRPPSFPHTLRHELTVVPTSEQQPLFQETFNSAFEYVYANFDAVDEHEI